MIFRFPAATTEFVDADQGRAGRISGRFKDAAYNDALDPLLRPSPLSQPPSSLRRSRLAGFPGGLATLAVLLYGLMIFHQRSLEPPVLALQFVYSRADFAEILTRWGAGAALLPANLLIDLAFVLAYGLFGHRLATRTPLPTALPVPLRPGFAGLLPAAAGLDALENGLEFYLAAHLDRAADALFLVAGLVSGGKWALIALFVALAVAALLRPR